ncbi:hypothetical protein [Nitratireductor thuwali]|uniref:Uncharacterized protein n=1 Tax=Nitratireductor thuwali TaxID=2267699 RepID=A0ABY5MNF4_9HYPH|nr:hypothetical protein NTH_04026 [Nitratireductor thuwali]
MGNALERIQRAQEIMTKIGPHMPVEDQLREIKKILAFVLTELTDHALAARKQDGAAEK